MAVTRSYDVGTATDRGRKRDQNQDKLDVFEPEDPGQLAQKGALYVVADGVGGNEAGAVASDRAVRKVIEAYYYGAVGLGVRESLDQAIQEANAATFQLAAEHPEWSGMGTTVVVAVVRGDELYVANVGDSRALLFRPGHEPRQLSVDHTWVGEQVRTGAMTPEEAQRSPRRHQITRSLGRRPQVAVELTPPHKLLPGDTLVLCSDGLSDMLSAADIGSVASSLPPGEAAERLVALANSRGGLDNITVVVLKWRDEAATPVLAVATPGRQKAPSGRWVMAFIGVVAVGAVLFALSRLGGRGPSVDLPTPTSEPTTPSPTSPSAASTTAVAFLPVTPTATLPLGPTSTLEPTATLMPATATSTPVPATRTPKPLGYSAPELLEPGQGEPVSDREVTLRWKWEGNLREDEWFDIWIWPRLERERAGSVDVTKDRKITIQPPGWVGEYSWKVKIVRGQPGAITGDLSLFSEERWFDFRGPSVAKTKPPPPVLVPTLTPEV